MAVYASLADRAHFSVRRVLVWTVNNFHPLVAEFFERAYLQLICSVPDQVDTLKDGERNQAVSGYRSNTRLDVQGHAGNGGIAGVNEECGSHDEPAMICFLTEAAPLPGPFLRHEDLIHMFLVEVHSGAAEYVERS